MFITWYFLYFILLVPSDKHHFQLRILLYEEQNFGRLPVDNASYPDNFQKYELHRTALTFVTDRDLALMSVLGDTFPDASCLLCRWCINKNIHSKQKKSFQTSEA